jgi:hypothetical protein
VKKHTVVAGVVAVATGIAGALVTISPALAGPVSVRGITTHTVIASATVPPTSTGEAEATCGAGELLLGGGYVVTSTSTDWRVYVDAPLNGSTWLVEPVNNDTVLPLNFSAYAICAMSVPGKKGVSGYTTHVVQTKVNVPLNQTGEADATCGAGELRTGGGYDVYNVSDNWSVYLNGPLNGNVWVVEIDNEVPATTPFDSFAVCLAKKNLKPIKGLTVSTVNTAATAPPNSVQTADVSCGPKELMTGGGHEIASIGPYWSIQASAPISGNDWQVTVADLDNLSRNFDSTAVCLAKA